MANQLGENVHQFGQLKWLWDDTRSAETEQFVVAIAAGVPCHKTATNLRIEAKEFGQRLRTIQTGHADVEQYQVNSRVLLLVYLQGFLAISCLPDRESVLLQPDIQ